MAVKTVGRGLPRMTMVAQRTSHRWRITGAAIVMQVALGGLYAWSVFHTALVEAFGATPSRVTLAFTIANVAVGVALFLGGLWLTRVGPRTVGLAAGVLYGLGGVLASFSADRLWLLYLGYGVLGGAGIGLGYIASVTTVIKWFPDRRGLAAGLAVAGMGAGPLLTAPLAAHLIGALGVFSTFMILGGAYLIMVAGAALFLHEPPTTAAPPEQRSDERQAAASTLTDYTMGEALRTWQWYGLWTVLFLNTSAGIALISQSAPLAQELTRADAFAAAGLVGAISLANVVGRFFWAWLSDFIGRRSVFLALFLIQAAVFLALPWANAFVVFAALACLVLLCYGGGFGTMPAFTADYFGAKHVGSIYGLMLSADSCGAILGPLLIASIHEMTGSYTPALFAIAGLMALSALIPFLIRTPPRAAGRGNVEDRALSQRATRNSAPVM